MSFKNSLLAQSRSRTHTTPAGFAARDTLSSYTNGSSIPTTAPAIMPSKLGKARRALGDARVAVANALSQSRSGVSHHRGGQFPMPLAADSDSVTFALAGMHAAGIIGSSVPPRKMSRIETSWDGAMPFRPAGVAEIERVRPRQQPALGSHNGAPPPLKHIDGRRIVGKWSAIGLHDEAQQPQL